MIVMGGENFDDYIKVKNLKIEGDEPHLIRLRTNDHTVAHIEILPSVEGGYMNLKVYSVSSDDDRTLIKWVAGIPMEDE
jgi:hypothetical protein